jgi:hypothetical protein
MAQRVADVLEAIDVEEQQAHRGSGASRGQKRLSETVVEEHSIGKGGEPVAEGSTFELSVACSLFGLVVSDREHDADLWV